MPDLTAASTDELDAELSRRQAPDAGSADQFTDEFTPYLAEQLRDSEVKAAYEAERRDDEVIQFGHPRWGL